MGWLSLAGLFEISQGSQRIGSAKGSEIRFPEGAPPFIGIVTLDSMGLQMYPDTGLVVLWEAGDTFSGGVLEPDSFPVLHLDALYWTFLKRSDKYYLRLWDTLHPARTEPLLIQRFPVDPGFRVEGTFIAPDSGATVILDDVLGLKRPYPVDGIIQGHWHDTPFSLIALDGGEEELFVIFEDATTDVSTYPAGRYLYVPRPNAGGKLTIDFNKATNPPCAFTEYATCLLAPPENYLSFAVTAGEKNYGYGH